MLKLSVQQLADLDHLEKLQYVDEVQKALIKGHPELAADGGLRTRLEVAYRHVTQLGFIDGASLTQFLAYEAFAPWFYKEPAINAWLTKPGAPVEHRFSDLVQVMNAKTREL